MQYKNPGMLTHSLASQKKEQLLLTKMKGGQTDVNRMLMKNMRGREAMDSQATKVKLHNNSSAIIKARNNSLERQIMLDDECVIVENDRQNKFRHDWEAQQYKKAQQQLINEVNSQMIIEKKKEKKK